MPGVKIKQHADSEGIFPGALSENLNKYRNLTQGEIAALVSNGNHAEQWQQIYVKDGFDPLKIKGCRFFGRVYLGALNDGYLQTDDVTLPIGLSDSTIGFVILDDNVAVHNVGYLAHFQIGSHCILYRVDEMVTGQNSTFGNGYIRENSDNDERNWLEICNESGGRAVLPFGGMRTADAWLWTRRRDDSALQEKFIRLTDRLAEDAATPGRVGTGSVIKNSRVIRDAQIGVSCTIDGINRLQNATILSSEEEPTVIRDGVEIIDSIIGYGNVVQFGVKAFNVLTGRNVKLNYGARVLHNVIGPNSTISCCEVLSNLVFGFHEQHHNNSFLIATTIGGQANIAAGATIGSNHNSRAADGEIVAGRGFWPGLVSNLKHNSVFAPFTLLAKANYNAEMRITLPFSLLSVNERDGMVQIFPAYWFKYNMYALARNTWKFAKRDKRKIKEQHIETDFLAPDTVESMLDAITVLQELINQTSGKKLSLREIENNMALDKEFEYFLDGAVNKQKARLLKPAQAVRLYRMMIFYYGARALSELMEQSGSDDMVSHLSNLYEEPDHLWHNVGGQLIADSDLNDLLDDVRNETIRSWREVHERYDRLWEQYPQQKRIHGIYALLQVEHIRLEDLDGTCIAGILTRQKEIAAQLRDWAFDSRRKDFSNPFRQATYHSEEEMRAVLVTPEEDPFLNDFAERTEEYIKILDKLIEEQ